MQVPTGTRLENGWPQALLNPEVLGMLSVFDWSEMKERNLENTRI